MTSSTGSHHSSSTGLIIIGIAFLLIGGLHALKPDLTWRMSRWQYRNGNALQPSSAGLMAIRIGGVIAFVAGIVLLIVGISK